MSDERLTPEQRLEEYKAVVSRADGTLIPLAKTTPEGRELFIASRYCVITEEMRDEYPQSLADRWNAFLLIDIYAQNGAELVPIAHNDWTVIGKDHASGSVGRHMYVSPTNEHEEASRRQWGWGEFALRVALEYRRMGLGSLMIATAGVTLDAMGMQTYYPGGMQLESKALARKYKEGAPSRIERYKIPISGISNNTGLTKIVQSFL